MLVLLAELLDSRRVGIPLTSRSKDSVLKELVNLAVPDDETVRESVLRAVQDREALLSTGIGDGVAIPHGKTSALEGLHLAAGVSELPVDFDALDGKPVQLFFLLVGPEKPPGLHVQALARISRVLRRESVRSRLRAARGADEFLEVIRTTEAE